MLSEALQDSFGYLLLVLLPVESAEHVTVQLRVEPVLRTDKLSVEICGASSVFHLFDEFRN